VPTQWSHLTLDAAKGELPRCDQPLEIRIAVVPIDDGSRVDFEWEPSVYGYRIDLAG
jgi:hypothetical protein